MNALGLELLRPWALWLLLLPLLLLALARLPGRPQRLATGTLEIWRLVLEGAPRARAGARPRIPPALWLLALALVLCALAASGPRPARPPSAREWTFVIDRSPALHLVAGRERFDEGFDPERALDGRTLAGPTRLELALARAAQIAGEHGAAGDRVRWVAPDLGPEAAFEGARPPARFASPPATPCEAPDWTRFDGPGTYWVSGREPRGPREQAGLVASGGPAVHGPVAAFGTTRLDWDGQGLVEVPDGAPRLALVVAPGLCSELRELASFYAESRGLELDGTGPAALTIQLAGEGEDVAIAAGRDGFLLEGRAARSGVPPVLPLHEPWLVAQAPTPLVLIAASPGRVLVALRALERIGGDPAALPVAFAALFDGCALPPPGIVPLGARQSAGPARSEPPKLPAPAPTPADDPPWIAGLVLLAALSALVGFGKLKR